MPCEPLRLERGYAESVNLALRSRVDVWGDRALSRPDGPTFESVKGFLKPLLLVGRPAGRKGTRLTDSGVYYVPMGEPGGRSFADGGPTEPFALHVADGSKLLLRQANGRSATIFVGAAGGERYGSCLARLEEPRLADGYLPVLTVRYADADGARYLQESLVARDPGTGALASHVRIQVTRGSSALRSTQVRVVVSDPSLTATGTEVRSAGRTLLAFSAGGTFGRDGALRYRLDLTDDMRNVVYLVRPIGKVRCDGLPGLKTPGANNVYGVHRVHFLADLDQADLLVLTLYAKLAHGMTRGAFIAGEGETLGPVPPGACAQAPGGEYYRSMYLPPSSAKRGSSGQASTGRCSCRSSGTAASRPPRNVRGTPRTSSHRATSGSRSSARG